MKVLELFKGTGSVGNYLKDNIEGVEVISLDSNSKFNATHTVDILKWDYKIYPSGYFDIIWASPDCTEYSIALTTRTRDFNKADPLVLKALEIIDYFKPKYYFIENPQTGYLKTRPFMKDLPFYDVSYCKYGFPYRKQTRIWTNLKGFEPKVCKRDCKFIVEKKHKQGKTVFDNEKSKRMTIPQNLIEDIFKTTFSHMASCGNRNYNAVTRDTKYQIPPKLIEELFNKTLDEKKT